MYKLLRCTCLHCFALKMDADEVARYRRRLELLAEGHLVEAAEQVSGGGVLAARVCHHALQNVIDDVTLSRHRSVCYYTAVLCGTCSIVHPYCSAFLLSACISNCRKLTMYRPLIVQELLSKVRFSGFHHQGFCRI